MNLAAALRRELVERAQNYAPGGDGHASARPHALCESYLMKKQAERSVARSGCPKFLPFLSERRSVRCFEEVATDPLQARFWPTCIP
jgi:hypothetical protein